MSGATFRLADHPGEASTDPSVYIVERIGSRGRVGGMLVRASDGRELRVTFANGEPVIPLLEPDAELADEYRRWMMGNGPGAPAGTGVTVDRIRQAIAEWRAGHDGADPTRDEVGERLDGVGGDWIGRVASAAGGYRALLRER
ncbi:MAG TPA: hypothetical protein VF302_10375 [Candidatus Limnocylindrales bacterium]